MQKYTLRPFHRFPSPFWNEEEEWEVKTREYSDVSIYEDKNNICVEVALPGMKEENIEISFEKGILWIKAEKKEEEKERKYYRKAMREYSFRLAVPGNVDETKEPEATYQDGILKLCFPKAKVSEPKKIQIKRK